MPENKTEERPPQLDNVRDNATQEDFKMKNKVWEMLEYAGPQLEEFPRAKRGLAQKIDGTMLDILELVIMLENKHYKKTTLGELDTKVDVLRHLIRLAASTKYTRSGKPCLPMKKWASHIQNRRRSQPANAVYSADITAALMIISSSQKKRR